MNSIITAVTGVFSAIGEWFVTFIPSVIEIFYVAETGLTLLGVLAVCGLAVSIFFLVMGLISNFLRFRG